MKYKAIFDTNSIRNAESATDFLGGRSELERFLKVAEIVIPDIVIDEIKCQKRRELDSKRDSFLSNPFRFLMKVDEEGTKKFDIDNWISGLIDDETIPHTIIFLTRKKALTEIRRLCLGNCPPFDKTSDKGFKDTYIYLTVLDYISSLKDEKAFLISKDGRLREAFSENKQIHVLENFDEFDKYLDIYFREPYFISRLKEEISEEITEENIKDIWLNADENWVMKLFVGDKTYFIEIDFSSREILDYTNSNITEGINNLKLSGNFSSTHSAVAEIKDYVKYFSDQEIIDLIQSAIENQQIYWIATDEDIKEFFNEIFLAKPQIISDDLKLQFSQYFST